MKVTKITYKRVFALPDYQNEQIGIEIDVQEGEIASEVFEAAKKFVLSKASNANTNAEIERAKKILEDPDHYTVAEYKKAQDLVKQSNDLDLPF